MQALAPIGALLGAPLAGWIADHAGRKAALMLVGLPYLFGYLMMVCATIIPHPVAFKTVTLVGRLITGVGLGWSCLATPVSEGFCFPIYVFNFYGISHQLYS